MFSYKKGEFDYVFYNKYDDNYLEPFFILEMKKGEEIVEYLAFQSREMRDFISYVEKGPNGWNSKSFDYNKFNESMVLYNFMFDNEILIEIYFNEGTLFSMSLDKEVLPFLIESYSKFKID